MNLGDIQRRVYSHLRDAGKTFVLEEEVEDWINDAYIDLAARLRHLEMEKSDVTDGTNAINFEAFSPEVMEIQKLRLGTDTVEFVNTAVWDLWSDDGMVPDHTLGRVFDLKIQLYPTPANATAYKLRYAYLPSILIDLGDIPELPTHLHTKLVDYAIWKAKLKLGEVEEAQGFFFEYERSLPAPPVGKIRLRPHPIRVTFEAGPYDTVDARHI